MGLGPRGVELLPGLGGPVYCSWVNRQPQMAITLPAWTATMFAILMLALGYYEDAFFFAGGTIFYILVSTSRRADTP